MKKKNNLHKNKSVNNNYKTNCKISESDNSKSLDNNEDHSFELESNDKSFELE